MTNPISTHVSAIDDGIVARARRTLGDHAQRSEQQLHELESDMVGLLADHGTIQEDRDGTRRLIESIRADLTRTRRALDRIEAGTYGLCPACGAAIAPARLEAIPESERCTDCA